MIWLYYKAYTPVSTEASSSVKIGKPLAKKSMMVP